MFTTASHSQRAGDFRDAIRAARMIGRGHFHPAELLRDLRRSASSSVATMTSRERLGLLALLDDVLDERLAGDQRQRLAGKPRRSVARGDDANGSHGEV